MLSKLSSLVLLAASSEARHSLRHEPGTLKVMVLNDIHVDLKYKQDETHGPLGAYGNDPPIDLLETVLHSMLEREGNPDIVLIPGDFAAHGLAASSHGPGDYHQLMKTLKQTSSTLYRILGRETLILPTFGNNDVKNHYEPPTAAEKEIFYSKVFDFWFSESKNRTLK